MKRIHRTITLFILIGALMFTSFPVSALSSKEDSGTTATGTETSVSTAGVATADTSPDVSAEVVFKRKEFEKHYLLSDGSFMAVVYPEAVHYQDEVGGWKEVDNTLTLSASTGRITSANKDFQVSFSEKAQAQNMISIQKGSYALSWSLTAQKAKGSALTSEKLTAQTATILNTETTTRDSFEAPGISSGLRYSNLFASAPEISVIYSVFHNKVEEDIYINSPTDIRSFSMNVTAPGLVAVVKKDGSVEFVDKEGVLQYRVGIPYMLDAKDEVLNDIEVTVEQGKSSFIITYTPNEKWLTAAERAYPILLDPSITTKEYNSNITDTYVKNGDTANHSAEISIYYGIKSGVLHRGYIKINNLPEINTDMPITEATATFTLKTGTNTGKTAEIHRVNQAWNASTITFANAPTSTTFLSSCPFNNSTMTFDLTANMSDMIEGGTNNYGYMIKYADESTTNPDYNGYYSSEYTTASKRPVITVKYGYALPDEVSVGGVYSFQNVGSGAFMTVDSGMDADATNVYQYNTQVPPLTSKEKFKLEYVSSTGGYLLRAMCSESGTNRVLDIARGGGFVESGCNVQIYRNTDSLAQHWFIVNWSDDEFLLIPRTNMSLALSAYPSAANGTADGITATSPGNIYVSAFTGSDYQKWRIIPDGSDDYCYVEITGVANVNEGDYIDLGCSSVPAGLEPRWESSNPAVATVSDDGRVEGLRAGYTDITVSCTVPSTGEVLQATERIYVTIPNGNYYLVNRQTGKYVQPDNDDGPDYTNTGILEQMDFDGGYYQRWAFTHIGGGYYKIICVKNGYAITVPSGQETVSGPNLLLADYVGSDNQKWLITGTDGGYRISAKCAGPELVMAVQVSDLSTLGEHLNIQQKSYVYNDSYKDEWYIRKEPPTSGYELPFQPDLWNNSVVQPNTNCYAYALNNQIKPTEYELWYMQPGEASEKTPLTQGTLTAERVVEYVEADAATLGFVFEEVGQYEVCPPGTYKVVLVVDPYNDYHWYRQNSDGYWSHKRGALQVTDIDASDHVIYDPQYADRHYASANYSEFVGYYAVTPLNNIYTGTWVAQKAQIDRIEFLPNSCSFASYEEAGRITRGMTYREVTALIGLPQRMITSGLVVVEYAFADDAFAHIEYVKNSEGLYVVESVEVFGQGAIK